MFSIVFACLRPIFLYFVNPLNLIFAWVCYSCFGVFNQLNSSIRLVCLRPIFLYLFKNLFLNKCCFSVFAYRWPKFPSVVLKSWAFGVYSHTLFSNMVLNKFCFGVSNILELSIVLVCLRPVFLQSFSVIVIKRFWTIIAEIIHVLVCWISWSFPWRRCAFGLYS